MHYSLRKEKNNIGEKKNKPKQQQQQKQAYWYREEDWWLPESESDGVMVDKMHELS